MRNDTVIDMTEWELIETKNNNLIFKRRNFKKWIPRESTNSWYTWDDKTPFAAEFNKEIFPDAETRIRRITAYLNGELKHEEELFNRIPVNDLLPDLRDDIINWLKVR